MDVEKLSVRQRGLTLLEMLTGMAVALVLLSIGIPSWATFTQNNKIVAARNQMMSTLAHARLAAVENGQFVTICPSSDQQTCHRDHLRWHEGYMTFIDNNSNRRRDAGERRLLAVAPPGNGIQIQTSSGRKSLRFNQQGSTSTNVTIRFCTGAGSKTVIVSISGRARLFDKMSDGSPVTCST